MPAIETVAASAQSLQAVAIAGVPNYDLKHPSYFEANLLRAKAQDLYEGAETIKKSEKLKKYLFPNRSENPEEYLIRAARAVFDNYCELSVGVRVSLTWRRPPARDLPASIKSFETDVDRRGTTANGFFRRLSERAAARGLEFVLVDAPPFPAGPDGLPLTEPSVADLESAEWRPFLQAVDADRVFDCELDDTGKPIYVVIQDDHEISAGPGQPRTLVERRIIWTRALRMVAEREPGSVVTGGLASKDATPWRVASTSLNRSGIVPLIPCYGIKVGEWQGDPITKDILCHCISIYNLNSDNDNALRLHGHPVPLVVGPKKPETMLAAGGKGIFLERFGDERVDASYLEPTGNGLEAIRETLDRTIGRIYEIAMAQSRKTTAQVQSAAAQRMDARAHSASLAGAASELENTERLVWETVVAFMDGPDAVRDFSGAVDYEGDFDDAFLDAAILAAFSQMAERGQLSKLTLLRILRDGPKAIKEMEPDEELTRIEDDRDTAAGAMPGFGASDGEKFDQPTPATPPSSGGPAPVPASGGQAK